MHKFSFKLVFLLAFLAGAATLASAQPADEDTPSEVPVGDVDAPEETAEQTEPGETGADTDGQEDSALAPEAAETELSEPESNDTPIDPGAAADDADAPALSEDDAEQAKAGTEPAEDAADPAPEAKEPEEESLEPEIDDAAEDAHPESTPAAEPPATEETTPMEDDFANLSMKTDGAFSLLFVPPAQYDAFQTELAHALEVGEDVYLARTFGPVMREFQEANDTATMYGFARPTDEYVQAGSSLCAAQIVAMPEAGELTEEERFRTIQLFISKAIEKADKRVTLFQSLADLKADGDEKTANERLETIRNLMNRPQVYAVHVLSLENLRAAVAASSEDETLQANLQSAFTFCLAEAERLRGKVNLAHP